jgi:DNA-binding NarL/FixJ family response regulator
MFPPSIRLSRMDGFAASREIRRIAPSVKILILSLYDKPNIAGAFWQLGVDGYVLKSEAGKSAGELLCRKTIAQRRRKALIERLLVWDEAACGEMDRAAPRQIYQGDSISLARSPNRGQGSMVVEQFSESAPLHWA